MLGTVVAIFGSFALLIWNAYRRADQRATPSEPTGELRLGSGES